MKPLLLASASIRRKELLTQIGVIYDSVSMDIDETVKVGESAKDYVVRLAKEKALAALASHKHRTVLAADTTVVVNGNILEKPENEADAFSMLSQLSGSQHEVLTGIALAKAVDNSTELEADIVVTKVTFSSLSHAQISSYINTKEPMGKAGAYGIQGKAALFVEHLEGSYSNVVGLPLAETGKLLEKHGIPIWT